MSLRQTAAWAHLSGVADLSDASLGDRLHQFCDFLAATVAKLAAARTPSPCPLGRDVACGLWTEGASVSWAVAARIGDCTAPMTSALQGVLRRCTVSRLIQVPPAPASFPREHTPPVEAFEQRRNLRRRQAHHAVLDLRPLELAVLETLVTHLRKQTLPSLLRSLSA